MTEETWLKMTDPEDFLRALARVSECPQDPVPQWLRSIASKLSDRKLRLFAIACCRRLAHQGLDPRLLHAIEVVEINIGGGTKASRKRKNVVKRSLANNVEWLNGREPAIVCALIGSSAVRVAAYTSWHCKYRAADGSTLVQEERLAQRRLLRDVIGNPFGSSAFSERWRTPTAMALATAMYESSDFGKMPMLANALEEAGCKDPAVFAHCRHSEGVHVRGCWVVDLVLGNA